MGGAWFYARNNKAVGPCSWEQLKELAARGEISGTDMVLEMGTKLWVAASTRPDLFPAPAAPASFTLSAKDILSSRHEMLAQAQVVPDSERCVQCGCCTYNCPMGIDVRDHARRGQPVFDSHCLTCSECVKRCPRGVLRFERIPLFVKK
jgi:ferredoxin